jgi:hypothetical protein
MLLPASIEPVHDQMVMNFIHSNRAGNTIIELNNLLLKVKNKTIEPVNLRIKPKITVS